MQEARPPLLPLILADVPRTFARMLGQEGIPFEYAGEGAAAGRFLLYDSAYSSRPRMAAVGQVPIDVRMFATGEAEDPYVALDDERTLRRHWRIGGLDISQEVARVDRASVRRRVMARLRGAIESAGGVWLRVAAYPFPYRSAFNFRINYDQYDRDDFDATLRIIDGHDEAFSHYVCAADFEQHPDVLARLRGRDVGSHGFWHHTYRDATENLRNVRRAIDALRDAGIQPAGFAAPHGRFNRGLHSALAVLGVRHSSEYGLAFDELPFFPSDLDILQIPVHPINLGLFLDAADRAFSGERSGEAVAADVASAHLTRVATAKYQAGEPIFLYGHPTARLGKYPHVLRTVLDTVWGFGAVWKTNLSEMAQWWRARAKVRLRVTRENRQIVCTIDERPQNFPIGLEYWRGDHVAPMAAEENVVRFLPEALGFQNRKTLPLPQPVRVDRSEGLRGSLLRYLDWERVTPVEEINATRWRGWVKRTLRRLRT